MVTVGYAPSYARDGRGHKLRANVRVKAAIKAIDDELAAESKFSRELQLKRLDSLLEMAIGQQNVTAGKACIAEQNDMLGYHRDNAPNAERELAKLERASEEERKLAVLAARLRTEEESQDRPNIRIGHG